MSIKSQKDAFIQYEADKYFQRNQHVVYDPEKDVVIKVLQEYQVRPSNVLEIGCSTGYRLQAIHDLIPGCHVTGIEPSNEAIAFGKSNFSNVTFVSGTGDNMSMFSPGAFDLVIIGFVLYVVDREILLKVVSETDKVLADGGILMIIDFFAERPSRNQYQHITDIEAYAYKQSYDEIFASTKLYHVLDKRSMQHSSKSYDLSNDFYDKYSLVSLKKDLTAAYK